VRNNYIELFIISCLSSILIGNVLIEYNKRDELNYKINILKKENARLNKLITKQNTDVCLANQILELSETKKNVIFISCD
jgi:hypothetical protein